MKISAAIFDMDGTIIDSMKYYESIGEKYLTSLGIKESKTLSKYFFTHTSVELADYLIKEFNVLKSKEQIIFELNETFLYYYQNIIEAKKGINFFMEYLKQNNVPIALLTASDRKIAEPCLIRNNLYSYFDEKVYCSEHNTSKHSKDIFLYTAKKLNAKIETTFMFEDALYAIKNAKEIGFKICGVLDNWCKPDWDKIKELSDFCINDYEEIIKKFENL